jgi:uncharacterized protein (DUF1330 family)
MKTTLSLLPALCAALAIGGASSMQAHAQTPSGAKAPAFYISEFVLRDPDGIKPYSAAVESTFMPFGGRYVARGGQVVSLEGEPGKRVVMIAFPSMEQALGWYNSPAYAELRPLRHKSATSRVVIVEGTGGLPPT